ncbi:MAG: vWA domain-containing protein, partial [Ktedonobacteraceae bacterium]
IYAILGMIYAPQGLMAGPECSTFATRIDSSIRTETMSEELIPDVSLVDNSEERLPLVLVLDCSASMDGPKLRALQDGLSDMDRELKADRKASKSVRILVVRFWGDDQVEADAWQDAMDFSPPRLVANGRTPTGAAMLLAVDEIESEKAAMRSAGVSYKRPLVYLMSDGAPTDDWRPASEQCVAAMGANKLTIFPIGVGDDANLEVLSKFSAKPALKLEGLKFKELFLWLSASVKAVSRATQGEAVQLAPTSSWASVRI